MKSLLFLLGITFCSKAMEKILPEKQIQSLGSLVLSLNNTPEEFKELPLRLQKKCFKKCITHKKQVWGPGYWNLFRDEELNNINYTKNGLRINLVGLPNNKTKCAYIDDHFNIQVCDDNTKKDCVSLRNRSPIHSLQWKDDTHIMDSAGVLWNIETEEKIKILPPSYKATTALWNEDNTKIVSFDKKRDTVDLWDVLLKEDKYFLCHAWKKFTKDKRVYWNKDCTEIAMAYIDFSAPGVSSQSKYKKRIGVYNLLNKTFRSICSLSSKSDFVWKGNDEIYIYKKGENSRVVIIDATSGERLFIIHDNNLRQFICNRDGIAFTFNKKNENVINPIYYPLLMLQWNRCINLSSDNTYLYWLLCQWTLIKKLSPSIKSMEDVIDDITVYLPLDKAQLIAIWDSFGNILQATLWDYKIKHFIKQ